MTSLLPPQQRSRTFDRLAELPLVVDSYSLTGLSRPWSAEFVRRTTLVVLSGAGDAVRGHLRDRGPDMDEATRADMAAYTGCIAGALTEHEFRSGLATAGFAEIEVGPTHRVHEHAGSASSAPASPSDRDLARSELSAAATRRELHERVQAFVARRVSSHADVMNLVTSDFPAMTR
jgi:hypothetical protein